MDRLQDLRTFIAVADEASFAQAARKLGASPTSVSRTIAALERAAGVQLLVRTTRTVRLTEDGAAFLERSRSGLAEIDAAFASARGTAETPTGTLTITAPVMFGRLHIVPVVAELLKRHPELRVRLLLLDRVVRLVEEGIDVAVRIADLPNSALHLRRIGGVRRVLTASPAYLAQISPIAKRTDLERHRLIIVENELLSADDAGWTATARLLVNSVEAAIAAAEAGLGVVETLSYQVAERLAAGTLQRVLPDESAPELPVNLLFQGTRARNPNIRAFIDLARERLSGSSL